MPKNPQKMCWPDLYQQKTERQKASLSKEKENKYKLNKKRFQELDTLYTKLYESFALGIIPEDKFKMMAASYESEQKNLQAAIQTYEEEQAREKSVEDNIKGFYELVDRYTSFEKLTQRMINEFIDKILVHKAEKIDGRRVQTVEVYLNFIGMIDFPEPEPDHEQEKIDAYWRDRYQRSKERESARRKKIIAAENEIIDAKKQAEWKKTSGIQG